MEKTKADNEIKGVCIQYSCYTFPSMYTYTLQMKASGFGFGMGTTGKYGEILGNASKYRRKLGKCFVAKYHYKLMVIRDVLHAFCFLC